MAALGATFFGVVSCSSGPPPEPANLPPLELESSAESFPGSPLTRGGPALQEAPDPVASAPSVEVRFQLLALREFPWEALHPLTGEAQLISAGEQSPLLASSLLASGARLGRGDEALHFREAVATRRWGASIEVARFTRSLETGRTTSFLFEQPSPHEGSAARELEIDVHLDPGGAVVVALRLAYPVDEFELPKAPPTTEEESSTASLEIDAPTVSGETVLLRASDAAENRPLAIAIPSPFVGHPAAAIVAFVEVEDTPDPTAGGGTDVAPTDEPEVLETASATGKSTGEIDSQSGTDHPAETVEPLADVTQSLTGLGRRRTRRPALLYLATSTQATLCEDLALSASEEELKTLAESIEQTLTKYAPRDLKKVGWALEQTAVLSLAAAAESEPLSLALRAVLARHAGQVGTDLPLLAELAEQAADAETWRASIEAENQIFLEDSSPAARGRAYDWLAARGQAPPGYYPLDTAKKRRTALAALLEASTPAGQ